MFNDYSLNFCEFFLSIFCNLLNLISIFIHLLHNLAAEWVVNVQEFGLVLISVEHHTFVKTLLAREDCRLLVVDALQGFHLMVDALEDAVAVLHLGVDDFVVRVV